MEMGDHMKEQKDKARQPKQQRSIQTKKQIMDAAMTLFSEKGFYTTNTKEIAKEAGVATGCFYSYFKDKKAVFMEALVIYYEQFNKNIQALMDSASPQISNPKEILQGLILSILEAHNVFTGFHNELIVMYYSDHEIQAVIEQQHIEGISFTLSHLVKWRSQIKVKDLEIAASMIYWTVHCCIDSILFKENEKSRKEKIINELVDMLSQYLF